MVLASAQAFLASLPSHFKTLHAQTLKELEPWLEAWITQNNLVSRQELDAQIKRLDQLTQIVQKLQTQLSAQAESSLENS